MPMTNSVVVNVTFNIIGNQPQFTFDPSASTNIPPGNWALFYNLTPQSDMGTLPGPFGWPDDTPPSQLPEGWEAAPAAPNQNRAIVVNILSSGQQPQTFPYTITVFDRNGNPHTSTDPEVVLDPP